jgi:hypothetical protein
MAPGRPLRPGGIAPNPSLARSDARFSPAAVRRSAPNRSVRCPTRLISTRLVHGTIVPITLSRRPGSPPTSHSSASTFPRPGLDLPGGRSRPRGRGTPPSWQFPPRSWRRRTGGRPRRRHRPAPSRGGRSARGCAGRARRWGSRCARSSGGRGSTSDTCGWWNSGSARPPRPRRWCGWPSPSTSIRSTCWSMRCASGCRRSWRRAGAAGLGRARLARAGGRPGRGRGRLARPGHRGGGAGPRAAPGVRGGRPRARTERGRERAWRGARLSGRASARPRTSRRQYPPPAGRPGNPACSPSRRRRASGPPAQGRPRRLGRGAGRGALRPARPAPHRRAPARVVRIPSILSAPRSGVLVAERAGQARRPALPAGAARATPRRAVIWPTAPERRRGEPASALFGAGDPAAPARPSGVLTGRAPRVR